MPSGASLLVLVILAVLMANAARGERQGWAGVLAAQLGPVVERCRSGAVDWRAPAVAHRPAAAATVDGGASPLPGCLPVELTELVTAAWQEGLPVADGLEALRLALDDAAELCRGRGMLARLLLWRALIAVAAVACARAFWLGGTGTGWLAIDRRDVATQGGAALLLIAGYQLALRLAPEPWLGGRALSAAALDWVAALLGIPRDAAPTPAGAPLAAALASLSARELASGVSLASERRRVLAGFRQRQDGADRRRLRRAEELLPLLELAGIGLPVALLLLPLLAPLAGR